MVYQAIASSIVRADVCQFCLPNVDEAPVRGHNERPSICCFAFSAGNAHILAAGTTDRTCFLWDLAAAQQLTPKQASGESPLLTFEKHEAAVVQVKFGPFNDNIASGCRNGAVMIWDVETGQLRRTFSKAHTGPVTSIDFMPTRVSDCMLVTASSDRCIKLWDMRYKRACVKTFRGHIDAVLDVKVSPHGRWIATGGREGVILLWSIEEGRILSSFSHQTHQHQDHQPFIGKHIDQKRVVPPGRGGPFLTAVRFHPHELLMASLSVPSSTVTSTQSTRGLASVKFWDLDHFECLSTFVLSPPGSSNTKNNTPSSSSDAGRAGTLPLLTDDARKRQYQEKSQTLGNISSMQPQTLRTATLPWQFSSKHWLDQKRHSISEPIVRPALRRYAVEFAQSGSCLLATDGQGCVSSILWEGAKQRDFTAQQATAMPTNFSPGRKNPALLYCRQNLQDWNIKSGNLFEMSAPSNLPCSLLYACIGDDYRSIQSFSINSSSLCAPPVIFGPRQRPTVDDERCMDYCRPIVGEKNTEKGSKVVTFPAYKVSVGSKRGEEKQVNLRTPTDVQVDSGVQSLITLEFDSTNEIVTNLDDAGYSSTSSVKPATTRNNLKLSAAPAIAEPPPHPRKCAGVVENVPNPAAQTIPKVTSEKTLFMPARHTAARMRRVSSLQHIDTAALNAALEEERKPAKHKNSDKSIVSTNPTPQNFRTGVIVKAEDSDQNEQVRKKKHAIVTALADLSSEFVKKESARSSTTSSSISNPITVIHNNIAACAKPATQRPVTSDAGGSASPQRCVVVADNSSTLTRQQPSHKEVVIISPNLTRRKNNTDRRTTSSLGGCFHHLVHNNTKGKQHLSLNDSSSETESIKNNSHATAAARNAMPPPLALPRTKRRAAADTSTLHTFLSTDAGMPLQAIKPTRACAVTTALQPEPKNMQNNETKPLPIDTPAAHPREHANSLQKLCRRSSNPFSATSSLAVAAPNPFLSASSMLMLTPPPPNSAAVLLNNNTNSSASADDAGDECCIAKQIIRSTPTALYILGERASNVHQMLEALRAQPVNAANRAGRSIAAVANRCDVFAAVTVAVQLQDAVTFVDLLNVLIKDDDGDASSAGVDDTNQKTVWSLTTCAALLPHIFTLIQHEMHAFALTACRAVRDIVRRFGPTLRELIRAPPPVGIDLARDARMEQCRQCMRHISRIQVYLSVQCRSNGSNGTTATAQRSSKNRHVRREYEQTLLALREFLTSNERSI